MKTFVTTHGEKILAAAIVIPCLWWMYLSGDELFFKSPASDSKMVTDLGAVRGALTATEPDLDDYRYARDVPRYESLADYHLIAAVGDGEPFRYDDGEEDPRRWDEQPANFEPGGHLFYGRPPEKGGVKVESRPGVEILFKEVFASILPPTDVTAQPQLGQVVISWQEGATNKWGGVQEFLVFKKAADEKEWPVKPTGTVAAHPPGLGAFGKVNFEKLKLARYSYSDHDVEPQKKYAYRVRTRGEKAPDQQIGKTKYLVQVDKNLQQNPQTDAAGKERIELLTAFTEPIGIMTQSNIAIVFKGDASVGGQTTATFLVKRWDVEKSDWTTATARNIPEGQDIIGKNKFRDPVAKKLREVIIKSGYRFIVLKVKMIEKFGMKQPVKVAVVKDFFTGKEHELMPGKTLGATTGDIPAGKTTPPDRPRGGRRHRPVP